MAIDTRNKIESLTGLEPVYQDSEEWFYQMFISRIPSNIDADALKKSLYHDYRIEVPIIHWNNQLFIRVSIQGYNSTEDTQGLISALDMLI